MLVEDYKSPEEGKQAFSAGLLSKMLRQRSNYVKQQTINELKSLDPM